MRRRTAWVMATASGLVIANNYYNQPLLVEFAKTFQVTERQAGAVSILTQAGYALGLLLFLPLGDMVERRALINLMLVLASGALISAAVSPSMEWLIVSSFGIGLTSIVPQLFPPFAAHLAEPHDRGRVIGIVMGGLLCGILLSRTIAGIVGAHFGWRVMFWIASGVMIVLVACLSALLPNDKPTFKGSYFNLMKSLWTLIREQPTLRETSLVAALQFAAFSAFWTTLAFHLYSLPASYGSDIAGLFGLLGVVGASAAPGVGKFADRKSPRLAALLSSLVFVIAYLSFVLGGYSIWGLIVGVILLDLGMQSAHVSNMTRNLGLDAEAMSRLNTVYMVNRFLGGALGSVLGNYAWSAWRWPGVCAAGLLFSILAIAVQCTPTSRFIRPG